jgi:hypothetical protein
MKSTLLLLSAVFGLAISAHARIGASLAECIQHYGKEVRPSHVADGLTYHYFVHGGRVIDAGFADNHVVRIIYANANGKAMTFDEAIGLIRDNGPDLVWHFPAPDDIDDNYVWYGYDLSIKGGSLDDQRTMFGKYDLKTYVLVIFNKDGIVDSVDHLD